MDLLYFILCAYGLTQIVIYGNIFDSIRPTKGKLGKLFSCHMCAGFWVGVFLLGISVLTELFNFEYSLINALLLGWLSSGTSYILGMTFGDCGIKIQENKDETQEHSGSKTLLHG